MLEFGGPEQIKKDLRDVYRGPIVETTVKNFKWALRLHLRGALPPARPSRSGLL